MRPKSFFLLLCGVLILTSGCGGGTPTPCAPSTLGAPGNLSPAHMAIVSLTPTLQWEYPSSVPSPYPYPAGAAGCGVSSFQVYLLKMGDHIDLGGSVGGSSMSFSPSMLEPASQYFWEVRAIVPGGHGPWSGFRTFFTGPICDTLVAPDAYYPEGTISDIWPKFYWHYPSTTCLPEGYRIDVSTDASFSDTSLSGGTGNPSTVWTTAHALNDCTQYFWRVAGINGTTLGPYSGVKTFTINTGGACATLVPTLVAPTLVPYLIPHFIPDLYANCRAGSGQLYGIVAGVPAGTQAEVLGRHQTQDGWWYLVRLPPNGPECWMFERSGKLDGDPDLIPTRLPPPLPTEPPGGGGQEGGGVCTLSQADCAKNQRFDPTTCSCR